MPSRFSTVGFPLLDESEFSDLATHLAAEAQRIPVSGGTYLLWASPGGEQVWLQGDSDGYLVGLAPHFAGKSQVSVYIRSILRRPGETSLDGTIRGWVNDETRPTGGILDCPIVIDVPDTLGGTFDVVIDPELLPQPPRPGRILQGQFWFSGTFTSTSPAKRGLLARLAHKSR